MNSPRSSFCACGVASSYQSKTISHSSQSEQFLGSVANFTSFFWRSVKDMVLVLLPSYFLCIDCHLYNDCQSSKQPMILNVDSEIKVAPGILIHGQCSIDESLLFFQFLSCGKNETGHGDKERNLRCFECRAEPMRKNSSTLFDYSILV